ncbi:YscO family type III secretion system apparatus protein [Yoonia sp. BS5-3]|uniref:YscO family type III secretion system apparatus protein n=1 Tax=Yoonia phaeophyticola TaxID=3137369 RepID=A0ABZ2V4Y2_9RHOB
MITQFKTLCHVKGLHEQNKLKALRAKRAAVETALAQEAAQKRVVAESRAALPAKEAALYDAIMQQPVPVERIDETKQKVLDLQAEHQDHEDEAERLTQIRIRCETERDEARVQYQIAQRDLEKFTTIKSDLITQQLQAIEAQEDAEIEDLFSKKQGIRI